MAMTPQGQEAATLCFGDTPWGIRLVEAEHPMGNQWIVCTDGGEGMTLAVFEFPDHAEAFVERCGPEGSTTAWQL